MPWVARDDVGTVALGRMLRDGVLAWAAPRHGAPRDLPSSPADRAGSLRPATPSHTVVSSLAGLWVRHGGSPPPRVDLVGRRGLHRAKPGSDAGGWTVAFHSGTAAREPTDVWAGVRVASSARCAADALRWADLSHAIPRIVTLLRSGAVSPGDIGRTVGQDDARGLGAARMRSAWAAIAGEMRREPRGPRGERSR